MAAYVSQTRLSVIQPYYPLRYRAADGLVTTSLPPLSFAFSNTPPNEILESIRSAGGQELSVKGKMVFIVENPVPEMIRSWVEAGAIKTSPAAINSANIESLSTLSLIRRIFSNFFCAHQYPAFSDPGHMDYSEKNWLQAKSSKRTADSTLTPRQRSKRPRATEEDDGSIAGDDDIIMEQVDAPGPDDGKIVWAIPPPPGFQGWGNVDDAPEAYGIFIRFVDETQNSTGERAIHDTLTKYFMGCLGNTADAVKNMYNKMKVDLGVLIHTRIGRELAHMAKCIDIGLQAQARIFPVIDGEQYMGCAIYGVGFQLHYYGTVLSPVTPESLNERLAAANSHRSSLSAIANIADDDAGSDINKDILACTSMMALRKELLQGALTAEDRDQIVALSRHLRFGPKMLNVSPDNIVRILSLVQHPEEEIPDDIPINPSMLFEMDRLALAWSAFGDLAPTCHFPGAPQVDLKKSRELPKHIGFRMIPRAEATLDMQQILSSKKFSNCTLNRRSGPYKDRLYTGLDGSRVLSALAAASGVTSTGKEQKMPVGSGVDVGILDEGF